MINQTVETYAHTPLTDTFERDIVNQLDDENTPQTFVLVSWNSSHVWLPVYV